MTRTAIIVAALGLAWPAAASAQAIPPAAAPGAYQRAVAAGYKAALYCAGIFNAGRTPAMIDADELAGIYADYDAIVPTLAAVVDRRAAIVSVAYDPAMPPRLARWSRRHGCTLAPIGTRPAAAPPAPVDTRIAAPSPARWPAGDAGIAPAPSPTLAGVVAGGFDGARFGKGSKTTGVVIVKDGRILAERYADGFGPFVSNRTWSVAKSIAGTLVGIAVRQGAIAVPARTTGSPPPPAPVPEWADPADPRRRIAMDDLLRMASGLHSDTAGNRTDALYFGGTAVTEQATGLPLAAEPGTRFRYANNDTLLAVRALRARLGERRYADFPSGGLFAPLGMAHTVAERDWQGNFILSSQVWSTARDLARLGQFWLQDGVWNGRRLLPEGWMRFMTTPLGPQPADGPGYGATLWLFGPDQGLPAGSYGAQGNRGQYVMVVPAARLVVVRRGEDPGGARFDPAAFTRAVLDALP